MSNYKNTKLCQPKNLDLTRIVFGEVKESKEVKGVPQYRRIDLSYKNDDGTIGELVMSTPSIVTSYGVCEIKGMNVGTEDSVSGYQLPLVLYNHGGATPEQKEFVAAFESISDYCRNYVVQNSYKLSKKNMDVMKDQSNKFNPLWYKKIIKKNDKGEDVGDEPDVERGPTLYGKLIVKKKMENKGFEFVTRFRDMDSGSEINPLTLIGKRCDARAVIKFESIFIGTKTTLQVKVREAIIRVVDSTFRSLLDSPPVKEASFSSSSLFSSSVVASTISTSPPNLDTLKISSCEDEDDIKNSFEDSEEKPQPPVKKSIVRKAKN